MKKVLSAILCVIMLAVVAVPAAYAEDGFNEILSNPEQHMNVRVDYTNPSNYQVVIPSILDANVSEYTFTAMTMNILDTEQVEVVMNDGAPVMLNKNNNPEITATFSFTTGIPDSKAVGIFFKDELESHVAAYPMIQNANEIPAGNYSGTAIFNVKLTAKE